jgi:mono/diheme cytochrome c family protein
LVDNDPEVPMTRDQKRNCRYQLRVSAPFVLAVMVTLSCFTLGFANEKHGHRKKTAELEKHWSAPPGAAGRLNPIPRTEESIMRGNTLFLRYCTGCHGVSGRGDGPASSGVEPRPADLTKMAGHHSDGDIAWKIANGRGPMPGWKNILSEEEMWDLTNFIQSLKH